MQIVSINPCQHKKNNTNDHLCSGARPSNHISCLREYKPGNMVIGKNREAHVSDKSAKHQQTNRTLHIYCKFTHELWVLPPAGPNPTGERTAQIHRIPGSIVYIELLKRVRVCASEHSNNIIPFRYRYPLKAQYYLRARELCTLAMRANELRNPGAPFARDDKRVAASEYPPAPPQHTFADKQSVSSV